MIDIHQHVQSVATLPTITAEAVSNVLGVGLSKYRENPDWEFHKGGPEGAFSEVLCKISRSSSRKWLVSLLYDPVQAPREGELSLVKYGQTENVDVNPRIPPEGTVSYAYRYEGLKLLFQFTAKSRKLRAVSIHSD